MRKLSPCCQAPCVLLTSHDEMICAKCCKTHEWNLNEDQPSLITSSRDGDDMKAIDASVNK